MCYHRQLAEVDVAVHVAVCVAVFIGWDFDKRIVCFLLLNAVVVAILVCCKDAK